MNLKEIIPMAELNEKLIRTTFSTAQKNYNVMQFCKFSNEQALFYNNERNKLFDEFGSEKETGRYEIKQEHVTEFKDKINAILDFDVENVVRLNIDMDDLENCKYPSDNEMWINAMDMMVIETFLDLQNKKV